MNQQPRIYATVDKTYEQRTIRARIEALFLDNIGKIVTHELILQVAKDPKTGVEPENWHQRLSELRTDKGYTILSHRDTPELKISEYMMPSPERRRIADKRVRPDKNTWQDVLKRANHQCEWGEDGMPCQLKEGDIDPVGGGHVKLTSDHKTPHSVNPDTDVNNPSVWRALCGRHQVMKKNYWDDETGKLNIIAIIQAASEKEKRSAYNFLKQYFGKT
jgi:hypothetical protein